ncbi:hypothetical protein [Enterocloster citroniae]|uniref:hypothetical protein n=1 Tax=Enterocloster citroniae TaxID=358743 RepID=UPI002E7742DC|nr:hypothetical protein [Enterocloster citroniae]
MANELQNVYGGETQIQRNTQADMMISRQAQEVQAAVVIAKKFPRDEYEAMERIKRACQRPSLAEQAVYSYPRGGKNVTGPSIRLAEAIAKSWGNIDAGVIELGKQEGRSEMMAYAWDLETNTRVSKTFSVEHSRDTKQGKKALTDDRDIYEATANFGARRMRACILSVVPGDVVDMALEECHHTLTSGNKEPMKERLDKMLEAFKKDFKVAREQLEEYCGRQYGAFGEEEIYILKGVFKAIKDGQAKVSDYFPIKSDAPDALSDKRPDKLEGNNA